MKDYTKMTKDELIKALAEKETAAPYMSAKDEETAKIAALEEERKNTYVTVTLPLDADPGSSNTLIATVNGKTIAIPKGEPVDIPIAFADVIAEVNADVRKAAAELLKVANETKEIRM